VQRTAVIPIAAGVALGLGVTAGAVLVRRRRAAGQRSAVSEWTCACGQRFRVSGIGRHRVYWIEDAAPDDPVVGDRCPACDRPLPAAA
jgi:hypothetical protein